MSEFSTLSGDVKAWFPRHGWTKNTSGHRLLRLPLLRLFQFEAPHHQVYVNDNLAGVWLQCHSPNASIRMLAVCLRDVSSEFRVVMPVLQEDWFSRPPSDELNRVMTRYHEALERSEVLLLAAFVLLRRLADQIVDATRPLLFADWKSAPRQMKTAIAAAKSGSLSALRPTCDMEKLGAALLNGTQWFEDLRQDDGVRDILVHKEHFFRVGARGSKAPDENDFSWQVRADLMRMKRGDIVNVDVLPVLRTSLEGLCDFMEQVYRSLNQGGDYAQGDTVFLTGNDEDVTSFWPRVERPGKMV